MVSVGTVACTFDKKEQKSRYNENVYLTKKKKEKKEETVEWKVKRETKRDCLKEKSIYIYTFGIQWGSVEKWRASLNGGRFSPSKLLSSAISLITLSHPSLPRGPRSASPQSLSGRGNDNHYFFVSATAYRNGGSKVVKEVSSAFSKIHAMHFTVYRGARISEISSSFIRFRVTGKCTLQPP